MRKVRTTTAFQDAAHLRAVLDLAVDGVITIDERGTIQAVNPAAEGLFGYLATELIGHNVSMLMPAAVATEHDSYLAKYIRTGEKKIIGTGREVLGRRKDGSVFPLYLAVSETDLGDRRIFTGFLHDLTALKEAEEQATQFGRILDDSLNEIFVFDAATLQFLHVNTGALRNIGYSKNEIQSLTAADIMPDVSADLFVESLKPLLSGDESVLHFESTHRRRGGTVYNVMVRLHAAQWKGRKAIVAIVLDITDRVQRDTELRIRNRAIQAALEGIVIADAAEKEHPIIFVNPAFERLSGYSAKEAFGCSCELLWGTEVESDELRQLQQAISNHLEFRTTLECRRKDGESFWNDISIAPVRSSTGTVTHLVAVMEDVSDRRQAQQQLLQSERLAAIGQMVTGLAHESRNALQRAQACLDMLSLDLEDRPEQLELTEKTRRALQDLHRYYEETRNYAAPILLEWRSVDLRRLWRTTWRDLEAVRFGRKIEIVETGSTTDLECEVDEHRIEQVFRNIMENAVAACPDHGRLTVDCSVVRFNGQWAVELRFQDNGPGFQSGTIKSVFEPFFTTKQKGTGLGMAIAHRIVGAHGGSISAAVGPEAGAEIIVVLPRSRSQ